MALQGNHGRCVTNYLQITSHESLICQAEPAELVIHMGIHTSIIQHQIWPEVLQYSRKHFCNCPAYQAINSCPETVREFLTVPNTRLDFGSGCVNSQVEQLFNNVFERSRLYHQQTVQMEAGDQVTDQGNRSLGAPPLMACLTHSNLMHTWSSIIIAAAVQEAGS